MVAPIFQGVPLPNPTGQSPATVNTGRPATTVSDHGLLQGLGDDDHQQYWNATRGAAALAAAIDAHSAALDPHGDRLYAQQQDADHVAAADPHGDRAHAAGLVNAHLIASDPHPQYALDTDLSAHVAATDPHGDRAFATSALATHTAASDPHGDRAFATSADTASMSTHTGASNPHSQYALGTAVTAAFAAHAADSNPHPIYLTQTEADALYDPLGSGGVTAHSALTGLTTGDDHTQYWNNTRGNAAIAAHAAASDPHGDRAYAVAKAGDTMTGDLYIASASPTNGVGKVLLIRDTVATRNVWMGMTGATFSYAGVGANEAWIHAGTSNITLGSDTTGTVKLVSNGNVRLTVSGTALTANTHVLPAGTFNLGSSGARWNYLYTNFVHADNTLNAGLNYISSAVTGSLVTAVAATSGFIHFGDATGGRWLSVSGASAILGPATTTFRSDNHNVTNLGSASNRWLTTFSSYQDVAGYTEYGGAGNGVFIGRGDLLYAGFPTTAAVLRSSNFVSLVSNSSVECLRADSNGSVRAGQPSLATTATNGFLYIPSCAGTPTGAPTAITGFAPMVVDSTNNKLYVYIGGAWRVMN